VERKLYDTLPKDTWCDDFVVFKLFKQEGQDETTKEQLGSAIYTNKELQSDIDKDDYSLVSQDKLLVEISNRLKNFYKREKIFGLFQEQDTDKNLLIQQINELTVPETK